MALGYPLHACSCGPLAIERYRSRISGSPLDRIDIHLEVSAVAYGDLVGAAEITTGHVSEAIQYRSLCRSSAGPFSGPPICYRHPFRRGAEQPGRTVTHPIGS